MHFIKPRLFVVSAFTHTKLETCSYILQHSETEEVVSHSPMQVTFICCAIAAYVDILQMRRGLQGTSNIASLLCRVSSLMRIIFRMDFLHKHSFCLFFHERHLHCTHSFIDLLDYGCLHLGILKTTFIFFQNKYSPSHGEHINATRLGYDFSQSKLTSIPSICEGSVSNF